VAWQESDRALPKFKLRTPAFMPGCKLTRWSYRRRKAHAGVW